MRTPPDRPSSLSSALRTSVASRLACRPTISMRTFASSPRVSSISVLLVLSRLLTRTPSSSSEAVALHYLNLLHITATLYLSSIFIWGVLNYNLLFLLEGFWGFGVLGFWGFLPEIFCWLDAEEKRERKKSVMEALILSSKVRKEPIYRYCTQWIWFLCIWFLSIFSSLATTCVLWYYWKKGAGMNGEKC